MSTSGNTSPRHQIGGASICCFQLNMADMDFTDLITVFFLWRAEKRRRHPWVHQILQGWEQFGDYHHLLQELRLDGRFQWYFHLSRTQFEDLLPRVGRRSASETQTTGAVSPLLNACPSVFEQTPTLHLVLPTKATLLRGLSIQDGDSAVMKELKVKLAQAVELKFKIHQYRKLATAFSPSLRSFLRKTLPGQEYEEVINTLAALIETGTEERVRGCVEKAGSPPSSSSTRATEVHNFFASCVVEEEREDSGNMESQGRQLVLQYMTDSKWTSFQSLFDFWQERS
ncbi:hypothetical protein AMECASPLE_038138, partial [Ameca splendens]